MDWKEFIKPNKRKIILTIIITIIILVSGVFNLSCTLTDTFSSPPEIACITTALLGLPFLASLSVLVDTYGSSFSTMGMIVGIVVGIILSYGLALVLTFSISKIKNINKK